ncbi:MAG: DUF159 family protein [Alcaligenaceae bacterium]|nr:MAG: DUF159 family protein [Alcaligenaceae bacterium]
MCTRYISPEDREIEAFWHIGRRERKLPQRPLNIYPLSVGPFIRRVRDEVAYAREWVEGQWGLIPPCSLTKTPTNTQGRRLSTVNARSEEVAAKPTYRDAWKRGQRCIIPAASFDEPNWETGKNEWWRFRRADGAPWGLAGLWNVWTDKATGEVCESYTMLTINADAHPLMNRMHKPDPKLPADAQDKRSVIPIEHGDVDQWLAGTIVEANELLKLSPVELFAAAPATTS